MGQKVIKISSKERNPKYEIPKTTDKKRECSKGYKKEHRKELTSALRPILKNEDLVKNVVSAIMKNEIMNNLSIAEIKKLARKNLKS